MRLRSKTAPPFSPIQYTTRLPSVDPADAISTYTRKRIRSV